MSLFLKNSRLQAAENESILQKKEKKQEGWKKGVKILKIKQKKVAKI